MENMQNKIEGASIFFAGVLADLGVEGAEYLYQILTATEEQIFDINFWRLVGMGIFAVLIKSVIKQGLVTVYKKFKVTLPKSFNK